MLLSFNWQTNYLFIPLAMAIMFDIRYIVTDSYKTIICPGNDNKTMNTGIAILNTMIMFLGQTTNGILELLRPNSKNKGKRIVSKYQYLWLFVAASLDLVSFIFLNSVNDFERLVESIFMLFPKSPISSFLSSSHFDEKSRLDIFLAILVILIKGFEIISEYIILKIKQANNRKKNTYT